MSLRNFVPLGALLLCSCDSVQPILNNGKVGIAFDSEPIPLLPPGFPVYPTSFSTESLGPVVEQALADVTFRSGLSKVGDDLCIDLVLEDVCLEDLLNNAAFNAIDDAIISEVPQIGDWVERYAIGQLDFSNPAPLSAGINEQLGRTFRGAVTFDEVKLKMTVTNRTADLWAVPIAFRLYVGNGESVNNKSALVTDGSATDSDSQPLTFFLQPGESRTIETENLAHLVDALNEVRTLSIDYDANIEVAEVDPASFGQWLGASKADDDGNGVADALSRWGLVFDEFKIDISGRGEVEIPVDTPDWLDDLVD